MRPEPTTARSTRTHPYPAEGIGSRPTWPEGITPDQKAAAVVQLAALGIEVL